MNEHMQTQALRHGLRRWHDS